VKIPDFYPDTLRPTQGNIRNNCVGCSSSSSVVILLFVVGNFIVAIQVFAHASPEALAKKEPSPIRRHREDRVGESTCSGEY
jgi:hypothetical protein